MKKIVCIVFIGILFSCKDQPKEKVFEVTGTVKNTTAKMVYLEENVPNSHPTIMDSAQIQTDGSFALKAPTKEESLYQLRLEGKLVPFALLINDVPKLKVHADLNNVAQPYTVEGSPASQGLIDFDKTTYNQGLTLFTLGSTVDSLGKAKASDSTIKVEYAKVESAAADLKKYTQDFLQNSKSPILSLYALSSFQNTATNLGIQGFSPSERAEIISSAASRFPSHAALQTINKSVPSSKAPDFTQPGVDGKPVSLSSFKGKYVLLDFWASWCAPCRRDNPNVVKAYNEFKDKNFTILGISLDQNKEAWQKAIQEDGLTWNHASDLKFWSNEAAALYGVQSIPANFLIDPQGNIIAQDLHGEEIENTLRRLVK
ncbi:MAG: AhpC/TSA family protein [Bacteroidota bacterium]|nr:AhpC/TSA family protein [Bacteroidota bacterium]